MRNLTTYVSAAALALSLAVAAAPASASVFVNVATSGGTGTNQVSWTPGAAGEGTLTISGITTHLNFNDSVFADGAGNDALLTLTATSDAPDLTTLGPIFLQGSLSGSFEYVLKSNPSVVLLHGDFTDFWINGVTGTAGGSGNFTSAAPGATLNLTSGVADLSKVFADNATFGFSNTSPGFFISGGKLQAFNGANVTGTFGGEVPEPASWALMIMGFGGVGAMVRRRKMSAALA